MYKFVIKLNTSSYIVHIFASSDTVTHPQKILKTQQIRDIKREVAKLQLKHEIASNYRNMKLIEISSALRDVGNLGEVVSGSVARKMKSGDYIQWYVL